MKQDLISRKYHVKIIDKAFDKVKKISRKKAFEKVQKVKGKETPLVTKFQPNLPSLSQKIRKHHEVMINEDPRLEKVFPKSSLVAYSRGKNLKDLLVRTKINTKRKSNRIKNGYYRCGRGFFQAMCNMFTHT